MSRNRMVSSVGCAVVVAVCILRVGAFGQEKHFSEMEQDAPMQDQNIYDQPAIDPSEMTDATGDVDQAAQDVSMSSLVADAAAQAESASEAAGVEYYGKERTGLLGNRLWFADAGLLTGGGDDFDANPASILSTGFNFPLFKHVDFSLAFSYSRQEGTVTILERRSYTTYERYTTYTYFWGWMIPTTYTRPVMRYYYVAVKRDAELTSMTGSASLYLSFRPDKRVNPFLAGGGYYVDQTIDVEGWGTTTYDGAGYMAGGGVEFKLGKRWNMISSGIYSEADEVEETSVGLLFSHWFAFRHAMRYGASYGTESEQALLQIGYMHEF